MISIDLLFEKVAKIQDPQNIELIFGDNSDTEIQSNTLSFSIVAPLPVVDLLMIYDSRVNRGLAVNYDFVHEDANLLNINSVIDWGGNVDLRVNADFICANSQSIDRNYDIKWLLNLSVFSVIEMVYESTIAVDHSIDESWINLSGLMHSKDVVYQNTLQLDKQINNIWLYPPAFESDVGIKWDNASITYHSVDNVYYYAAAIPNHTKDIAWQDTVQIARNTTAPEQIKYMGFLDLLFTHQHRPQNSGSLDLIFNDDYIDYPHLFDTGDSVMINNTVSVTRSDGIEIHVQSANIACDTDSWCYTADLSVKFEHESLVADHPVIMIKMNHLSWLVEVESIDYQSGFNQNTLSVKCRSLTAVFDSGSLSADFPDGISANQLAMQQIQEIGLDTGFDLEWGIEDWIIPGNIYSYTDSSRLDIIKAPINAVNALLLSHPTEPLFLVKSRYKQMPWSLENMHVDFGVSDKDILTISKQYIEKPMYDAVFVSGDVAGLTAHCRRDGAAGNKVAPIVIERLITEQQAALERGRSVLASVGKQQNIQVSMPLYAETPILYQSDIVKINDFIGYLRSYSVRAESDAKGSVTIRQSLGIECNLEDWGAL